MNLTDITQLLSALVAALPRRDLRGASFLVADMETRRSRARLFVNQNSFARASKLIQTSIPGLRYVFRRFSPLQTFERLCVNKQV